jgi:hypothetical protein
MSLVPSAQRAQITRAAEALRSVHITGAPTSFSPPVTMAVGPLSVNLAFRLTISGTCMNLFAKKFSVITIAPLLSKVILHMHEGKPLTPIFNEFTGI